VDGDRVELCHAVIYIHTALLTSKTEYIIPDKERQIAHCLQLYSIQHVVTDTAVKSYSRQ